MPSLERYATSRVEQRRDYRNGHYTRGLDTTIGHLDDLPVPRTRDVLAFSVGDRENEQAWKDLLDDLKGRGVKAIDLWKSRWQPGHAQCH